MSFKEAAKNFDSETVEEAAKYRETIKDALVDVLAQIPGALSQHDDQDYVSVEVLSGIVGLFAERGMQATVRAALLKDQRADGASAAYAESSTLLDVLICLAKGEPVV